MAGGARNVVLTGFMATGKTTVGRLLAERLGMGFVDTDELIESRHGPISEIFEQHGEECFRDMERAVAQELSERRNLVIATGGRMMLDDRCAGFLEPSSAVVCLTANAETLIGRLVGDGVGNRPLVDTPEIVSRVRQLLAERARGYAYFRAVHTDGRDPEEVVNAVVDLLEFSPRLAVELRDCGDQRGDDG